MRLQAWYFRNRWFPSLRWHFLTAPPGHFFLTSDRPLAWSVPVHGLSDSPAALSHPEVELSVPLSRRHAFIAVGSGSAVSLETPISASDVNSRTLALAERFVFSPKQKYLTECLAKTAAR